MNGVRFLVLALVVAWVMAFPAAALGQASPDHLFESDSDDRREAGPRRHRRYGHHRRRRRGDGDDQRRYRLSEDPRDPTPPTARRSASESAT